MTQPSLIDALRTVPLFSHLPEQQLQMVASLGQEEYVAAGTVLFTEGEPAGKFYVLLDGALQITKRVGNEQILLNTHYPGEFSGEISILANTPHTATGRAVVPSHLMSMLPEQFHHMLTTCVTITNKIMRKMAERLQSTEAITRQREKMFALGKLAAGLAHELNNPASAAQRSAAHLRQAIQNLEQSALQLNRCGLSDQCLTQLRALQHTALQTVAARPDLDALTRSDYEETWMTWLDQHDVASAWELAPTFVTAGLTPPHLDPYTTNLAPQTLNDALTWLATSIEVQQLLSEVEHCTTRISDLVHAVKAYSHMDQVPIQQVDIHAELESTLTMLAYRTRTNVQIIRSYDENVPPIHAYGNELNQVWMNLLDNALDAIGDRGSIEIRTSYEHGQCVLVEITDSGSGISPDIQSRIFEPFFTTKGVGAGTGLGLDIVYRTVVKRHHGDIHVQSQPGKTTFQVRLPIHQGSSLPSITS